jgi:ADP-ribose pyrophosphatase YjhB (NUDIX family)
MPKRDYYNDPNAPAANSLVPAVTAVVQDQAGRVLMIRRTDNDLYALPGGAQDLGETPAQAAVRETKEETGLDVEATGVVGIYSDPAHVIAYDDGEVRQEFSICFRARHVGGEARTSSESKEVLWIDPADLDDLNVHPTVRLRITHGLDQHAEPYFS